MADTLSSAPLSQTATEWKQDEVVFQLQDIKESYYIPASDQCIIDVRKAGIQDMELEGDHAGLAVGNLTGIRGGVQLLEF